MLCKSPTGCYSILPAWLNECWFFFFFFIKKESVLAWCVERYQESKSNLTPSLFLYWLGLLILWGYPTCFRPICQGLEMWWVGGCVDLTMLGFVLQLIMVIYNIIIKPHPLQLYTSLFHTYTNSLSPLLCASLWQLDWVNKFSLYVLFGPLLLHSWVSLTPTYKLLYFWFLNKSWYQFNLLLKCFCRIFAF